MFKIKFNISYEIKYLIYGLIQGEDFTVNGSFA